MKKLLMLCLAVSVLSACADLNKEQQLKRIEQEQKRLDLLSKKIKDKRMDDVSVFKINTM